MAGHVATDTDFEADPEFDALCVERHEEDIAYLIALADQAERMNDRTYGEVA